MTLDDSQAQDLDLDRTDKLPVLDGAVVDADVADDAVRMEFTAAVPSIKSIFQRPSGVDLPSLAESVRSVQERIARQNAEYEALNIAHAKALDAEVVASARAHALTAEIAELRATLEAERARSRENAAALTAQDAAADDARERIEDAVQEAARYRAEYQALRDTLATRDAAVAQALHSLNERDAQLDALQREHAQIVPVLEERAKTGTQLEADLRAGRAHAETLAAELKSAQQTLAALRAQLKAGNDELAATRIDLGTVKAQSEAYLEELQTREWRRGFDHNLFRELDSKIGVVQEGRGLIQAERDDLRQHLADIEARLSARDETIAQMTAAAAAGVALRTQHERDLKNLEGAHAELTVKIAAVEHERIRLKSELADRDHAIEAAIAAGSSEADHIKEALAAAEKMRVELSGQVQELQSEAQTRDDEMEVLLAHLQEARRPIQSVETDVKRLTDELAAKSMTLEGLMEENRHLRLDVERTQAGLEEREFLIRRLERSETSNANVLGRIQSTIEQLGIPAGGTPVPAPEQCAAELVRIDGGHNTAHAVARRTRIGRAPGCELQIDSSSVSRHHALVLMGQRDAIIEDLNSTNGVLVNGRRISRQLLSDGDLLTIGETQFRFTWTIAPRVPDAAATPGAAAMPGSADMPGAAGAQLQ